MAKHKKKQHEKKESCDKSKYSNTADVMVRLVQEGEETVGGSYKQKRESLKCDRAEFSQLLLIWLLSAGIMVIALGIILVFKGFDAFWRDLICQTDTLCLMFSLVLSATLEQVWNNKREVKFKLVMVAEILLSILGLLFYSVRCIAEIIITQITVAKSYDTLEELGLKFGSFFNDEHFLYEFNILYVCIGTVLVIYGFYLRSLTELDLEKK